MSNKLDAMIDSLSDNIMEMVMQKVAMKLATNLSAQVDEQEEVKPVKKAKTMTREEFFALEEEVQSSKDLSELDFEPVSAKSLRYNGYMPSDLWIVNHLAITQKYNGRWSGKLKAYTFPTHADAVNFAQSYKIKTTMDDTDRHNVKAYKAERAKAKAEYYAKKAAENK